MALCMNWLNLPWKLVILFTGTSVASSEVSRVGSDMSDWMSLVLIVNDRLSYTARMCALNCSSVPSP